MESVTNAKRVNKNFVKYGYSKESEILPSTRKNKKWMVFDPNKERWVHFGDKRYEDYTVHQDKERRENYHNRMGRFKDAYKYSPGYLSLVLLW